MVKCIYSVNYVCVKIVLSRLGSHLKNTLSGFPSRVENVSVFSPWKCYYYYSSCALIIIIISVAQLTPNLFLKCLTVALCLWGTKLEAVTIIGMRWAVCSLEAWHRSWKSAMLIALHKSTLLFPFRFTEKHGIMVSGPTSLRYSMASSSCPKTTTITTFWKATQKKNEQKKQTNK